MTFFIIFKGLLSARNSLKPKSGPLILLAILCTYFENQAILELIIFFHVSKCK